MRCGRCAGINGRARGGCCGKNECRHAAIKVCAAALPARSRILRGIMARCLSCARGCSPKPETAAEGRFSAPQRRFFLLLISVRPVCAARSDYRSRTARGMRTGILPEFRSIRTRSSGRTAPDIRACRSSRIADSRPAAWAGARLRASTARTAFACMRIRSPAAFPVCSSPPVCAQAGSSYPAVFPACRGTVFSGRRLCRARCSRSCGRLRVCTGVRWGRIRSFPPSLIPRFPGRISCSAPLHRIPGQRTGCV